MNKSDSGCAILTFALEISISCNLNHIQAAVRRTRIAQTDKETRFERRFEEPGVGSANAPVIGDS